MKNIPFETESTLRLPRQVQLKRIQRVIRQELTPLQQQAILSYYFQEKTIPEIARERNVNKSTVSRTLHRAEEKLRKYLRY